MPQTSLDRRRFLLLASSTAIAGVAGCSESNADDTPAENDNAESDADDTSTEYDNVESDADDTPAENATDDGPPVVEMITDNQGTYFDPKGLAVEPGTTVRFVNASGTHGTTAYHPEHGGPLRIPEEAEPWDSAIYSEPDRSFEVTFDVEGVYDHYCPPHESMGMVGRLIVGEPHDGPGTTPPEELPPGAREALPSTEEVLDAGTVAGP